MDFLKHIDNFKIKSLLWQLPQVLLGVLLLSLLHKSNFTIQTKDYRFYLLKSDRPTYLYLGPIVLASAYTPMINPMYRISASLGPIYLVVYGALGMIILINRFIKKLFINETS